MHFTAGPTHSRSLGPLGLHGTPQALYMVHLTVLVVMSLVFGKTEPVNQEPPYPPEFPKYLRCYRCLLETKELGCLLGSDICLASPGSSCMTLFIKNSSGSDIMVSDCCRKEQMSDCSHTRTSPVFGFWMFSRCCFQDFCNSPQNRAL
ncbi:PREDICTED: lymphocyte antigen 6 complex locus protein G5c [Myotis davidii]|uniref:Lymphocyte antigen 6 complex locus protein G5c n=1 Tax=Myotis davidii TaxID=225400 RepID=L5LB03_MYODS|nr:PREDICTED: lymphocyte antigen 6 complex locus protein G5c [Myotis davidii]ELK23382.1 Lymphocyte antigen 6 complex locus protein G5c [Myotis davidii]